MTAVAGDVSVRGRRGPGRRRRRRGARPHRRARQQRRRQRPARRRPGAVRHGDVAADHGRRPQRRVHVPARRRSSHARAGRRVDRQHLLDHGSRCQRAERDRLHGGEGRAAQPDAAARVRVGRSRGAGELGVTRVHRHRDDPRRAGGHGHDDVDRQPHADAPGRASCRRSSTPSCSWRRTPPGTSPATTSTSTAGRTPPTATSRSRRSTTSGTPTRRASARPTPASLPAPTGSRPSPPASPAFTTPPTHPRVSCIRGLRAGKPPLHTLRCRKPSRWVRCGGRG